MSILGPFNVGYPVVFRSGGDTTRVAFGKHIQEIERIYGIVNALDSDKISASDLDGKLGNFKPNMSFSDITGTLDMSRITGNLDFSRISGNLDASRVVGKLSNANIDAQNVNGLQSIVNGLIPKDKGDGITDFEAEEDGYFTFGNGLLIQWGVSDKGINHIGHVTFPKKFPNKCLVVSASTYTKDGSLNGKEYGGSYCLLNINQWDDSGFGFNTQTEYFGSDWTAYVSYIAIGY